MAMRILGISGSLRRDSFNSALLRAAVGLAPEGVLIEVGSIRGIPLYDGDVEADEGIPPPVRALKDEIASSEALLLSTPEYNRSIPGVFKNAIDWLSRPSADIPRVFGGRPVALMGATTGRGATKGARAAWLPVLQRLGMLIFSADGLGVARARDAFEEGELVDGAVRGELEAFLKGFAEFIGRPRSEATGR